MSQKSNRNRRNQRLVRDLIIWWEQNGREFPWRRTSDAFRVLVAEILLQRSRSGTVAKVYERVFDTWPTAHDMAVAEVSSIEEAIGPLGLKSRAARLKAAAQGWLGFDKVPKSEPELLRLPGVGPYIASATAMAMSWDSSPCVDAVSIRVVRRILGETGGSLSEHQAAILFYSGASKNQWRSLNWAILDLAAAICMPRVPRCSICPLSNHCESAKHD